MASTEHPRKRTTCADTPEWGFRMVALRLRLGLRWTALVATSNRRTALLRPYGRLLVQSLVPQSRQLFSFHCGKIKF